MSKDPKFYICKLCGNLAGMIYDSGAVPVCCGQEMTELVPNTQEASYEKHLPAIEKEGNTITVKVGSAPHPMIPEHFIGWVYLHTEKGGQRKALSPGDKPEVKFVVAEDDKALAAYAFCNLHGLWKTAL